MKTSDKEYEIYGLSIVQSPVTGIWYVRDGDAVLADRETLKGAKRAARRITAGGIA